MASSTGRSKNWLLILIRQWHGWIGVSLAVFILLVCASGIFLNHKDFLTGKKAERKPEPATSTIRTSTQLTSLPIGFERALAAAREQFGDVSIREVQLKTERDALVYKVIVAEGVELVMDASTGRTTVKDGYTKREQAQAGATYARGIDWPKLIKDAHTGKVAGFAGKLAVDVVSIVIMLLTLSGIYLWAVPRLRQRKAASQASPPARAAAVPAT